MAIVALDRGVTAGITASVPFCGCLGSYAGSLQGHQTE